MVTIRDTYNLKKYAGDVGIEIEVEGNNLPRNVKKWRGEDDQSLRGEAIEYVTKKGVAAEDVDDTLDALRDAFVNAGSDFHEAIRAGVHVHVNIQDMTHTQVANFAALFYVFENVLVKFCGEFREGNLFCLRTDDADYIHRMLKRALVMGDFQQLEDDNLRYAALNWKPSAMYGSLEFRSMRSTNNFEVISQWVKMLLEIRKKALIYNTPKDILSDFSMNTPEDFMRKVFGEYADLLFFDGYEVAMQDGMYNSQDFIHCADWEKLEARVARVMRDRKEFARIVGLQAREVIVDEGPVVEDRPVPEHIEWNVLKPGIFAGEEAPPIKEKEWDNA